MNEPDGFIAIEKCPDCSSKVFLKKVIYKDDEKSEYPFHYAIWKCSKCGIIFVEPLLPEGEPEWINPDLRPLKFTKIKKEIKE